ncbi:MAG: flagellar basal-body rod protein FlgC [Conexibacter sp.]|jgi:flagellar basal-body rod protein FlgC|nr:flagellar basal-body rod protein FlgC [Conexibacter sp.]
MSFFDAINVSASGMSAERLRMDVTSENLANAQTTRSATGGPYRRKEVVLQQASGDGGFGDVLTASIGGVTASAPPKGVAVSGIVADPTPSQMVYDPGHPDANAQGYVAMPNVNSVTEMVDLISEQRSYEANVTAMQSAKTLFTKTFDLLK